MATNSVLPGLPSSVTSRIIPVNDLDFHILEALPPSSEQAVAKPPLLVLLHGFPEIAYSWRKIIPSLAASGYAVVAPDLRGFGQTRERGGQIRQIGFEEDLAPYQMLNIVTDVVALVYTLGYNAVHAVIGHDFGSAIAAHCALIRPDLFKSVVLMSVPFGGPPPISWAGNPNAPAPLQLFNQQLATLDPPRKHYMIYFSTADANADMTNPPGGLSSFLRTYFHVKSADWKKNSGVGPLSSFTPAALSVIPHYYIMPLSQTMPEALALEGPSEEDIQHNTWFTEQELSVYTSQYLATGFQGGLNLYRCNAADPLRWSKNLLVFAGKQIEVPAMYIAGSHDWGTYQFPGAAEAMRTKTCKDMKDEDFMIIEGAGHWVQQEQPEALVHHILRFIKKV